MNSARITRYHELIAQYERTRSKAHKARAVKKMNALYRHMTREERAAVDGKEQA